MKYLKLNKVVLSEMAKDYQLYLLVSIPLLYLLIFKYIPMYGASIAFKDFVAFKGIGGSPWVGLKHFERFWNSYEFWAVMKNTVSLSFYQLAAGFILPIIFALNLNYIRHVFFKKTVQMVSYAPHFISMVVMVGILIQFLAPHTGIVNNVMQLLGMQKLDFMGNSQYFQHIYVWSGVWQNMGYSCILYLAALAGIDPHLHEAAVVDGATKLKRIWHVDIPGILPIVVILLILNTGHLLDLGFEKVILMQNPLNLDNSEIIDTYVYKVGLTSKIPNYSYASAIGLFKNVLNMILLLLVNQTARKLKQSSLW